MRPVAIALFGALLNAALIASASAADAASAGHPGTICIKTYEIDHTSTPDESTIVFHMLGGKTWVNKLASPCSGLKFNGFSYEVSGPRELCGNQGTIHVLHTGAVCLLGPFTPGEEKSDSRH